MRYILNKDTDIDKLLEELNELDGVNVKVDEVEVDEPQPDEICIVIKSKAIRVELERILILLEEQNEVELAIEKLYELDKLFQKIELGIYDFAV